MNKNDLIDQVTEATNGTKKETERVVEAVLEGIVAALAKGEKVDLREFGSLQVSAKPERQGRNPRTGEALTIAARRIAVFKPSRSLSSRINKMPEGVDEADDSLTAETGAQLSEESTKIHGDKFKA